MASTADHSSAEGPRMTSPQTSCRYDLEIDMSSKSTQARVVRLVGRGKRVLELGCATGYMSRILRDRGCHVVAVELDADAAARAAEFCDRVIIGDLDRINIDRELGESRFDVVVAADVLEHLKDPVRVLRHVRRHLEPGARVVASIPNIAHGSVRLALLTGTFPYTEVGLLDRTHLRFFTAGSLDRLFVDSGFKITRIQRQQQSIERSEVQFDNDKVPPGVLEAIAKDRDALTYQFIVTAEPTAEDGRDGDLRADLADDGVQYEVVELPRDMDELAAEKAELERRLGAMDRRLEGVNAQRERATRDLVALRDEMAARESETRHRIRSQIQELTLARNEIDRLGIALQERERQLERRLQVLWELGEEQERLRGQVVDLERERDAAFRERTKALRRIALAEKEREAVAHLVEGMRHNQELIEEFDQDRADLRRRVAALTERERNLRELLLDAHTQMIHRDEEFQVMLTEVVARAGAVREGSTAHRGLVSPAPSGHLEYQLLVRRIRDVADGCIPSDATVLVVSKGDPELLQLGSRPAWHFPQTDDGEYAGFHPATSQEAIDHLERLRARGGTFLLFPATSLWWLEHYAAFRDHLESRYRAVASVDGVCRIVDLRGTGTSPDPTDEGSTRDSGNGHGDVRRKIGVLGHPLRSLRKARLPR